MSQHEALQRLLIGRRITNVASLGEFGNLTTLGISLDSGEVLRIGAEPNVETDIRLTFLVDRVRHSTEKL